MQHPIIKKTTKLERIFLLMALIIIGLILGTVIGFAYVFITKSNPNDLNALRFMQISSQIFTFVLPPIIYALLVKEKPTNDLGLKKSKILWVLIGIAMIFLIMPLNSVFAEWNANLTLPDSMSRIEYLMKQMQEAATEMIEKFVNVDTVGGLILNLFMIAGLAALGEELLFRSIIQTSLIKICKNAHIGILIASAIFSFIHFEFYGFVPRLILGMLLGYMFYFSGSIWIPMLMHFLNNGTVVLVYFLNNKGITNIDVDTFGQTSIPILIISIVVMIVLFIFSIKYSDKERTITGC
ncbi:MAG: CPBP family intramembrane metalloprotease [Bacteroidales bacterium]|nr:CPBP family intramembrane metalloprotease [Bacteroidales bacterium]